MDRLKSILEDVLSHYVSEGLNGHTYLVKDEANKLFAIVAIGIFDKRRVTFTGVLVRIVGEKIVIEEDRNSDPVYEELMDAGIPREQIILAYAGEPVPDAV